MKEQPFLVTADDRSGAMESAALVADAGLRTWVRSWDGDGLSDREARCAVLDLRSRHVSAGESELRMREVLASVGRPCAHKMDSTLRGNWATEVGVLAEFGGVLVVAAYPSAGRTCVHGEVRVHGIPLLDTEFAADLRSSVPTSRPAEALRAAGVAEVVEASDARAVREWVEAGGRGVCVADAATDDDVGSTIGALRGDGRIAVAGTALAVGATVASSSRWRERTALRSPALPAGDVLVVCGSRHPASRTQAQAAAGLSGVSVLYPPEELLADAEVVALELAVRAHDHLHAARPTLVVLLGGDTADAFLAERAVRVLGSLAAGLAVGEVVVDGRPLTILTKPGGFGQDQLLVDLLRARRTS